MKIGCIKQMITQVSHEKAVTEVAMERLCQIIVFPNLIYYFHNNMFRGIFLNILTPYLLHRKVTEKKRIRANRALDFL